MSWLDHDWIQADRSTKIPLTNRKTINVKRTRPLPWSSKYCKTICRPYLNFHSSSARARPPLAVCVTIVTANSKNSSKNVIHLISNTISVEPCRSSCKLSNRLWWHLILKRLKFKSSWRGIRCEYSCFSCWWVNSA